MKTFAVFGDVHGRITLMLVLSRRWEEETGRTLDGVLQVGDMGAFPDTSRLDRATARHAARDSDELGYAEYLRGCSEGAALLGEAGWPVVWVRGNHEDFEHLDQFRAPTAVDPWGRLRFLPDGTQTTVAGLRIGALGGKQRPHVERGRGKRARARHRKAARRLDDPSWISERAARTAYPDGGLDILMSHAGPQAVLSRGGSPLLEEAARRIRPRVHLFGHHHLQIGPTDGPGGATVIGLDHLEFVGERLQTGCWGILELDEAALKWTWGERFRWTSQLTRSTYRGWIPSLTTAASPSVQRSGDTIQEALSAT